MRVAAIAKSVADKPSYLDVGCGYGDFLRHVRKFLPHAEGIEKEPRIFYALDIDRPDYISIADAKWIDKTYDLVFVGWMEPGQDFRDSIARITDVIVTTLDQGISLAAEFDGHGFDRIAWWRTPSWEDVNTEIMNKYYTTIPDAERAALAKLRGAHNLWYVYARPGKSDLIINAINKQLETEAVRPLDRYEFEDVLDEFGYQYLRRLENPAAPERLWEVQF